MLSCLQNTAHRTFLHSANAERTQKVVHPWASRDRGSAAVGRIRHLHCWLAHSDLVWAPPAPPPKCLGSPAVIKHHQSPAHWLVHCVLWGWLAMLISRNYPSSANKNSQLLTGFPEIFSDLWFSPFAHFNHFISREHTACIWSGVSSSFEGFSLNLWCITAFDSVSWSPSSPMDCTCSVWSRLCLLLLPSLASNKLLKRSMNAWAMGRKKKQHYLETTDNVVLFRMDRWANKRQT